MDTCRTIGCTVHVLGQERLALVVATVYMIHSAPTHGSVRVQLKVMARLATLLTRVYGTWWLDDAFAKVNVVGPGTNHVVKLV